MSNNIKYINIKDSHQFVFKDKNLYTRKIFLLMKKIKVDLIKLIFFYNNQY